MQLTVDWLPYGLAVTSLIFLALALWSLRRGGTARLLAATCAGTGLATAVILIGLDRVDADRRDEPASAGRTFDVAAAYGMAGPGVGARAPDFTLPRVDNGQLVRLSDLNCRRPVVLVFGEFG